MKKNKSDRVEEAAVPYQKFDSEILPGSGNVFADLGLKNAEAHLDKAKLAAVIHSAVKDRGLTQAEAAKAMKLDQPKVSKIIRGDFRDFSVERLLTCVIRLGFDVDVTIRSQSSGGSQNGKLNISLA